VILRTKYKHVGYLVRGMEEFRGQTGVLPAIF